MGEWLSQQISAGGPAMLPLLLLAGVSPLAALGLYALGALLPNKTWALRFGLTSLALGIGVPLTAWLYATVRMQRVLAEVLPQVSPEDVSTLEAAARAKSFALPWAALLSSPWLVFAGFGLLGLALLKHPALASASPTTKSASPAPGLFEAPK